MAVYASPENYMTDSEEIKEEVLSTGTKKYASPEDYITLPDTDEEEAQPDISIPASEQEQAPIVTRMKYASPEDYMTGSSELEQPTEKLPEYIDPSTIKLYETVEEMNEWGVPVKVNKLTDYGRAFLKDELAVAPNAAVPGASQMRLWGMQFMHRREESPSMYTLDEFDKGTMGQLPDRMPIEYARMIESGEIEPVMEDPGIKKVLDDIQWTKRNMGISVEAGITASGHAIAAGAKDFVVNTTDATRWVKLGSMFYLHAAMPLNIQKQRLGRTIMKDVFGMEETPEIDAYIDELKAAREEYREVDAAIQQMESANKWQRDLAASSDRSVMRMKEQGQRFVDANYRMGAAYVINEIRDSLTQSIPTFAGIRTLSAAGRFAGAAAAAGKAGEAVQVSNKFLSAATLYKSALLAQAVTPQELGGADLIENVSRNMFFPMWNGFLQGTGMKRGLMYATDMIISTGFSGFDYKMNLENPDIDKLQALGIFISDVARDMALSEGGLEHVDYGAKNIPIVRKGITYAKAKGLDLQARTAGKYYFKATQQAAIKMAEDLLPDTDLKEFREMPPQAFNEHGMERMTDKLDAENKKAVEDYFVQTMMESTKIVNRMQTLDKYTGSNTLQEFNKLIGTKVTTFSDEERIAGETGIRTTHPDDIQNYNAPKMVYEVILGDGTRVFSEDPSPQVMYTMKVVRGQGPEQGAPAVAGKAGGLILSKKSVDDQDIGIHVTREYNRALRFAGENGAAAAGAGAGMNTPNPAGITRGTSKDWDSYIRSYEIDITKGGLVMSERVNDPAEEALRAQMDVEQGSGAATRYQQEMYVIKPKGQDNTSAEAGALYPGNAELGKVLMLNDSIDWSPEGLIAGIDELLNNGMPVRMASFDSKYNTTAQAEAALTKELNRKGTTPERAKIIRDMILANHREGLVPRVLDYRPLSDAEKLLYQQLRKALVIIDSETSTNAQANREIRKLIQSKGYNSIGYLNRYEGAGKVSGTLDYILLNTESFKPMSPDNSYFGKGKSISEQPRVAVEGTKQPKPYFLGIKNPKNIENGELYIESDLIKAGYDGIATFDDQSRRVWIPFSNAQVIDISKMSAKPAEVIMAEVDDLLFKKHTDASILHQIFTDAFGKDYTNVRKNYPKKGGTRAAIKQFVSHHSPDIIKMQEIYRGVDAYRPTTKKIGKRSYKLTSAEEDAELSQFLATAIKHHGITRADVANAFEQAKRATGATNDLGFLYSKEEAYMNKDGTASIRYKNDTFLSKEQAKIIFDDINGSILLRELSNEMRTSGLLSPAVLAIMTKADVFSQKDYKGPAALKNIMKFTPTMDYAARLDEHSQYPFHQVFMKMVDGTKVASIRTAEYLDRIGKAAGTEMARDENGNLVPKVTDAHALWKIQQDEVALKQLDDYADFIQGNFLPSRHTDFVRNANSDRYVKKSGGQYVRSEGATKDFINTDDSLIRYFPDFGLLSKEGKEAFIKDAKKNNPGIDFIKYVSADGSKVMLQKVSNKAVETVKEGLTFEEIQSGKAQEEYIRSLGTDADGVPPTIPDAIFKIVNEMAVITRELGGEVTELRIRAALNTPSEKTLIPKHISDADRNKLFSIFHTQGFDAAVAFGKTLNGWSRELYLPSKQRSRNVIVNAVQGRGFNDRFLETRFGREQIEESVDLIRRFRRHVTSVIRENLVSPHTSQIAYMFNRMQAFVNPGDKIETEKAVKLRKDIEGMINAAQGKQLDAEGWVKFLNTLSAEVMPIVLFSPDKSFRNLMQNSVYFEGYNPFKAFGTPMSKEDAEFFFYHVDAKAALNELYLGFRFNPATTTAGKVRNVLRKKLEQWSTYAKADNLNRAGIYRMYLVTMRDVMKDMLEPFELTTKPAVTDADGKVISEAVTKQVLRIRDDVKPGALQEALHRSGFDFFNPTEQKTLMTINATKGFDEFVRNCGAIAARKVNFDYETAGKGPYAVGASQALDRLMTYPRGYLALLRSHWNVIKSNDATPRHKRYAARQIGGMFIRGMLAGNIYARVFGRETNPYNPANILNGIAPGGLGPVVLDQAQDITHNIIGALFTGEDRFISAATAGLSKIADMAIPFYKQVWSIIEASFDKKYLDRYAYRKLASWFDTTYVPRKDQYDRERTMWQMVAYTLSGGGEALTKEEMRRKIVTREVNDARNKQKNMIANYARDLKPPHKIIREAKAWAKSHNGKWLDDKDEARIWLDWANQVTWQSLSEKQKRDVRFMQDRDKLNAYLIKYYK